MFKRYWNWNYIYQDTQEQWMKHWFFFFFFFQSSHLAIQHIYSSELPTGQSTCESHLISKKQRNRSNAKDGGLKRTKDIKLLSKLEVSKSMRPVEIHSKISKYLPSNEIFINVNCLRRVKNMNWSHIFGKRQL